MKKTTWNKLTDNIKKGLKGLNKGIPFEGFGTLGDYICNIQKGRYDLIFAASGVGKTAFVNSAYVYGAIKFIQKNPNYINKLEIVYFSLELTAEEQLGKYICSRLFEDHGIIISYNELLSKGNHTLQPHILELIEKYNLEMEELESKFLFFRYKVNPDSLYNILLGYAKTRGTIIYDSTGEITGYTPNDPNLITEIVIDHIGLIDLGKYADLKLAIDTASRHLVMFRNLFGFSPVVISQINRSQEQMNRRGDGDNWHPVQSDIKNTGSVAEDSNTIIAVASPFYLMVDKCLGFDITRFKDRYRMIKIVKNRDGPTNILASFLFIGELGKFEQLGPASDYEVSPPETLRKVNQFYATKRKEEQDDGFDD